MKHFHDHAYNASSHENLETLLYNACLAITGAIPILVFSKEKIYEEFLI